MLAKFTQYYVHFKKICCFASMPTNVISTYTFSNVVLSYENQPRGRETVRNEWSYQCRSRNSFEMTEPGFPASRATTHERLVVCDL